MYESCLEQSKNYLLVEVPQRLLFLFVGCLLISSQCNAQKGSVLEEKKPASLDNAYFALSAKTQFPIQHALGIEFRDHSGFAFTLGLGQLSRAYTVAAIGFLPEEDENQELRKQFIEDKMKNGLVFEAGAFYYPRRFKDFYIGFNIQFQRFTLPATPQELVENYGFAEQIDQDQLSEALNSDVAQFFYENTII